MKKILLLFSFFLSQNIFAQEHEKDSLVNHKLVFGKEKSGTVCVNGLEKLEFATSLNRTFNEVLQLHFYGPAMTSGRIWVAATQEKNKKNNPVHFIDASVDLTVKEFPLHASYSFGSDQIGRKANVTYVGPGMSLYLSDIKDFHKFFHILRFSTSYQTLTEHRQNIVSGIFEDESVVIGKEWEKTAFFQIQPFHLTHHLTIFSEGLYRGRGHESFQEFEIGFRHKKIFQEMIGLGIRTQWENLKLHQTNVILRFNLSSPNPRHL